ncbi:hypothetical protein CRUP_011548 [Coryphaenoides rupestris]|nr:hypothetical protein CRUP_011548 [Coryphaenoides rupestris]
MSQNIVRGLFALLLIVLEWTRPCLPSPVRPICDQRVIKHFIQEARDAESAMRLCKEGCGFLEPLTVPQTTVVHDIWEGKTAEVRAQEVQAGLWLLQQALAVLQRSVTNTALNGHIDSSIRNLLSTTAEYDPTAGVPANGEETWRVSTGPELLQVYLNFLRGKVFMLLSRAQACQQDGS